MRANRLSHRPADYQQALQLYLACVEADPDFAPAWARLGRLYRVMGKYGADPAARLEQAKEALARAVALNPDLSFAQTQYAAIEVDLGRAVEAMVRLLSRATHQRNDAELFAGLVTARRYSGLLDAAVAAHLRAIELDPLVPTSVVQAYWMRGDVALALAEGTKLAGGSLRAMVLALAGRDDEAIADLRDQQGRMPHPVMRHYTVALRTVLEGDRAAAIRGSIRCAARRSSPRLPPRPMHATAPRWRCSSRRAARRSCGKEKGAASFSGRPLDEARRLAVAALADRRHERIAGHVSGKA